jgi:hypothetical protein
MQDAPVDADIDPLPGEVEPDRVLPSGQGEKAGGVDGPFDLNGRSPPQLCPGPGRRALSALRPTRIRRKPLNFIP